MEDLSENKKPVKIDRNSDINTQRDDESINTNTECEHFEKTESDCAIENAQHSEPENIKKESEIVFKDAKDLLFEFQNESCKREIDAKKDQESSTKTVKEESNEEYTEKDLVFMDETHQDAQPKVYDIVCIYINKILLFTHSYGMPHHIKYYIYSLHFIS